MLDRSGSKNTRYSYGYEYHPKWLAESLVTNLFFLLVCAEHNEITLNLAKGETSRPQKKGSMLTHLKASRGQLAIAADCLVFACALPCTQSPVPWATWARIRMDHQAGSMKKSTSPSMQHNKRVFSFLCCGINMSLGIYTKDDARLLRYRKKLVRSA
jgi:hypothetical protein